VVGVGTAPQVRGMRGGGDPVHGCWGGGMATIPGAGGPGASMGRGTHPRGPGSAPVKFRGTIGFFLSRGGNGFRRTDETLLMGRAGGRAFREGGPFSSCCGLPGPYVSARTPPPALERAPLHRLKRPLNYTPRKVVVERGRVARRMASPTWARRGGARQRVRVFDRGFRGGDPLTRVHAATT